MQGAKLLLRCACQGQHPPGLHHLRLSPPLTGSAVVLLPPLPHSERLARAERELAAAQAELASVEGWAAELSGQEEQYWHSRNEFQLRLQEHMDERDALAHRCGGVGMGWGGSAGSASAADSLAAC